MACTFFILFCTTIKIICQLRNSFENIPSPLSQHHFMNPPTHNSPSSWSDKRDNVIGHIQNFKVEVSKIMLIRNKVYYGKNIDNSHKIRFPEGRYSISYKNNEMNKISFEIRYTTESLSNGQRKIKSTQSKRRWKIYENLISRVDIITRKIPFITL